MLRAWLAPGLFPTPAFQPPWPPDTNLRAAAQGTLGGKVLWREALYSRTTLWIQTEEEERSFRTSCLAPGLEERTSGIVSHVLTPGLCI